MSQQMNVLCCFNCTMYQVHIVKKSNKWQCKVCGKKQSIQIVYFQGSGSDCRKQVQHLNYLKAKKEGQQSFHSVIIDEYGLDCEVNESDEIEPCNCPNRVKRSAGKWSKYLETDEEDNWNSESFDEKENRSAPQDVIQGCGKRERKRNQFYSLSSTQNLSNIKSQSDLWPYEPKAGTSRSRTYPIVENSSRNPDKWGECLNEEVMKHSTSKAKVDKNEIRDKVSTSSNTPSKNHIFDDLNDDLEVNIDF